MTHDVRKGENCIRKQVQYTKNIFSLSGFTPDTLIIPLFKIITIYYSLKNNIRSCFNIICSKQFKKSRSKDAPKNVFLFMQIKLDLRERKTTELGFVLGTKFSIPRLSFPYLALLI